MPHRPAAISLGDSRTAPSGAHVAFAKRIHDGGMLDTMKGGSSL
jgi:hypothetical protein